MLNEKRERNLVDTKGPLVAIGAAIGICIVNALLGFAVTRWAFGKEMNTFLAIVFGSFGVRAIMVIVAVWACIGPFGLDQVLFAVTFAVTCFVFLMGEILFFHQWFEKQKRQVRLPVTELLKKNDSETVRTTYRLQLA